MEYYSATKKGGNPAIYDNMDASCGHYAKWNRSDRERQTPHDLNYRWNFFFNDTATTEIYTLSLHDALPISWLFLNYGFLRVLSEENKNINSKIYLHPHVHCSIIYNSQDMEST